MDLSACGKTIAVFWLQLCRLSFDENNMECDLPWCILESQINETGFALTSKIRWPLSWFFRQDGSQGKYVIGLFVSDIYKVTSRLE
jgi:hypothetical protein